MRMNDWVSELVRNNHVIPISPLLAPEDDDEEESKRGLQGQ